MAKNTGTGDISAWRKIQTAHDSARYESDYRINGRDAAAVFTTGGTTAFVEWLIHDGFGIPIPHGAAGFLGALLGLMCARFFKPGR